MTKSLTLIILLVAGLFFTGLYPVSAMDQTDQPPSAAAVEPEFEFQPVVEGEKVSHDFLIRNTGTGVLKIKNVKLGCDCTTAGDYAREIPPGGEAGIPIKVNTDNYGGTKFQQEILVFTNDPKNEMLTFTIVGDVERFVTIDPLRVILSGEAGSEIKVVVKIIPEPKYPFKIKRTTAERDEYISYKLKKNKKKGETGYLLTIKNKAKKKIRYFDQIVLETDSLMRPKLTIKVFGNITEKKETEGDGPLGLITN
jgi:hypothetical protein